MVSEDPVVISDESHLTMVQVGTILQVSFIWRAILTHEKVYLWSATSEAHGLIACCQLNAAAFCCLSFHCQAVMSTL